MNRSFKLPEGWTRQEYNESHHKDARGHFTDGLQPEGLGEFVYHDSPPWQLLLITNSNERRWRELVGFYDATDSAPIPLNQVWMAFTPSKSPGLRAILSRYTCNWGPSVCEELTPHHKDDMVHFTALDTKILFKVELVGICRRKWDTVPTGHGLRSLGRMGG